MSVQSPLTAREQTALLERMEFRGTSSRKSWSCDGECGEDIQGTHNRTRSSVWVLGSGKSRRNYHHHCALRYALYRLPQSDVSQLRIEVRMAELTQNVRLMGYQSTDLLDPEVFEEAFRDLTLMSFKTDSEEGLTPTEVKELREHLKMFRPYIRFGELLQRLREGLDTLDNYTKYLG